MLLDWAPSDSCVVSVLFVPVAVVSAVVAVVAVAVVVGWLYILFFST